MSWFWVGLTLIEVFYRRPLVDDQLVGGRIRRVASARQM